jgi:hypothetical protein
MHNSPCLVIMESSGHENQTSQVESLISAFLERIFHPKLVAETLLTSTIDSLYMDQTISKLQIILVTNQEYRRSKAYCECDSE